MAQWKQTLEPYVKVIETVKQTVSNPVAGADLIIGAVIISDAGPSSALITSQKEFLKTFASSEISQDYTDSLDELYLGDNKTLASTMWLNAYRLAGSGNLLISRASKSEGLIFAKALDPEDTHDYILRDNEILRQTESFKFVIDDGTITTKDGEIINIGDVTTANDGWAVSIKDIGVIGNRVNDNGPLYDYFVDNLYDLVKKLNETTKFFSPSFTFYVDEKCTTEIELTEDSSGEDKRSAKAVIFNVVYMAGDGIMEPKVIDAEGKVEYWGYDSDGHMKTNWGETDPHKGTPDIDSTGVGCAYIIPATISWSGTTQSVINLNDKNHSGYVVPEYYASNLYNSRIDIKVRIRRFNHNAVQQLVTEEGSNDSPYTVLTSVLDVYTKKGLQVPTQSVLDYDFYEFAVYDPGISSDWQLFNVGNVGGRGDISITDLNNSLSYLHLTLPQDLSLLNLEYYDYDASKTNKNTGIKLNNNVPGHWVQMISSSTETELKKSDLAVTSPTHEVGEEVFVNYGSATDPNIKYFKYVADGNQEISVNVRIGNGDSIALLNASNGDIMKAWDRIEEDERYIVEGMTDLGCTESIVQNYMANIAINSNYFYAASTVNSTNYMVIANKKSKILANSKKVYFLSPWDYDDGSVGYLFNCSPSVIYWEVVLRNKSNNNEFAAAFGQNTGVVTIVNLSKEFKKTERQLLLTKKINTIFHDLYLESYYINDNYTNQTDDDVMKEECNSRLMVRISKAMPVLLNQFKGKKCTTKTFEQAEDVINYFFKTTILPTKAIAEYQVIIVNNELNDDAAARANKMYVTVNVRYLNSIKYITVYHNAYPVGLDFGE